MIPFAKHPRLRGLSRYVEGEVGARQARRIQDHLAECERCRDDYAFLMEVRRVARQISHPSPPRDTLREILERRDAGERIILPTSPPPRRSFSTGLAGPLLLLLSLLVVGGLVLGSGEASAGASVLTIGPERPELGQALEVGFRAASRLADEERVVLRGRYRSAGEGASVELELGAPFTDTLARSGDGLFTGTIWLPPSAVYAIFAVEDPAGTRIETGVGRPWEVLAHDEQGRPLLGALEQRFRAMEILGRPEEMTRTAVRMTELYPDEPSGWSLRLIVERRGAEEEEARRLTRTHRQQLGRLERIVSRLEDPGADRLAALVSYANALGETESEERWTGRLLEEHPNHALAQRERIESIVAGSRALSGDPGEALRALELEWDRAGAVDRTLLPLAFDLAMSSGDWESVRAWADRYARLAPSQAAAIALKLAVTPADSADGMDRLRGALFELDAGGPERPLAVTRAEHARSAASERRRLLAALGRALVAEGRLDAARDTLALATADGWDPALFRQLAATWAEAGRDAEALRLYGMAAADPLAEPGLEREAERTLGPIDPEAWSSAVGAGRRELTRRIEASFADRPRGDGEARVVDADGREVELGARLRGRTSLLAFWVSGAEESEALAGLAGRLAEGGVEVVAIWAEPPAEELRASGPDFATFHDVAREASEELGIWSRPSYVVLDDAGRVRHVGRSVEDAFRHAVVLAADKRESP